MCSRVLYQRFILLSFILRAAFISVCKSHRSAPRFIWKNVAPVSTLCVFPGTPSRSCAPAQTQSFKVFGHARACISTRDKVRERDHSLGLKLPGLSPCLPSPRTGYIAGTLFRRTSVPDLIAPGSSLTIDRVRQDSSLRSAFIRLVSLLTRAILFAVCTRPRVHAYMCTRTQMRVHPRDRIKRIRVRWIEFNMVITSENAFRLCLKELRGKPLRAKRLS